MSQEILPNSQPQLTPSDQKPTKGAIIGLIIAISLFLFNCSVALVPDYRHTEIVGFFALALILLLSIISALLFLPLIKSRKTLALVGIILTMILPTSLLFLNSPLRDAMEYVGKLWTEKRYPISKLDQVISCRQDSNKEKLELPPSSVLLDIETDFYILSPDRKLKLAPIEGTSGTGSDSQVYTISANRNYFVVEYPQKNEVLIYKTNSNSYWRLRSSSKYRSLDAIKMTADEKKLIYKVSTMDLASPIYGVLDLNSCQSEYYDSPSKMEIDVSPIVYESPSLTLGNKTYKVETPTYKTEKGFAQSSLIMIYDNQTNKSEVYFDPESANIGKGFISWLNLIGDNELLFCFYPEKEEDKIKEGVYLLSKEKILKQIFQFQFKGFGFKVIAQF